MGFLVYFFLPTCTMVCRGVILLLGLVLLAHSQDIKMLVYNNMGNAAAATASTNLVAAASSDFTVTPTFEANDPGFLFDPIDLSYDIAVYITDDTAPDRRPNTGMHRLEDFANAGKVVFVTGLRALSLAQDSPPSHRPYFFPGGPTHQEFYDMDLVDLLGGVAPGRQNSSDGNPDSTQRYATSPYCDPILNRRFGDIRDDLANPANNPGAFDDLDCVIPGTGAYGCWYVADSIAAIGDSPGTNDFYCPPITVRPVANNGLVVFIAGTTFSLSEFFSDDYNVMYNNLLDYAARLPGVIPGTPAFDEVVYKHVLVVTDADIRNGGDDLDIKAVLAGVQHQEFIPIFDYILGFDAINEFLNDNTGIPSHYEAVISYNLLDTYPSDFLFSALEDFATAGGIVIWIDTNELDDTFAQQTQYTFLGGSNYTLIPNGGITPTIFNPFSSNAACAPAFNGPYGTITGSITSFVTTFSIMNNWSMTGLFINDTDPAITCLGANSVPFPGAAISVRPMGALNGAIFFFENSDDTDNQYVWGDQDSPYYIMLNNLLAFAVSPAVIAADPHVLTFDNSALELPFDAAKKYSFFSSETIEFRMETYNKLGDSYVRSIGITLEGHQILATLDARFNPLIFVDNTPLRIGDSYEFSIGTLRVTQPETNSMSKAMKNMARFMNIQAEIPGQFTIAGGNFARAYGFWNVEIQPAMHTESSGGLLTSHRVRSADVDLSSFEVSSLF